jgi:hypothetical protein
MAGPQRLAGVTSCKRPGLRHRATQKKWCCSWLALSLRVYRMVELSEWQGALLSEGMIAVYGEKQVEAPNPSSPASINVPLQSFQ